MKLEELTQTIIQQLRPGTDTYNVKVVFIISLNADITTTGFKKNYDKVIVEDLHDKIRNELKKIE